MARCLLVALLFLVVSPSFTRADELPGKARPELAPGYKTRLIEGFTVLLSDETMKHVADPAFDRKPLEVLERELKTIVRIVPTKVVNVLRNVRIWVEWDEKRQMSNGRGGTAVAVYFGGHQLAMLDRGENPLKAKSVVVLSLRSLTREHQPRYDTGRCVLLHEMAHAVHVELLGSNNIQIKAAYKQAMERKLYEPRAYVATNEMEFFAELSCAYFGQLHHYPQRRSELKTHDPVSFALLEQVWGKAREAAADTRIDDRSASPGNEEKLTLAEIPLGKPLLGPDWTLRELNNRPVVILLWNASSVDSLTSLNKLTDWHKELSEFGLIVVAVHLYGATPMDAAAIARSRGVPFSVREDRWVTNGLVREFKDFPLGFVFNHQGRCVFRGRPFDAEPAMREAVGAALVASTQRKQFTVPLAPLVEQIRKGKALSSVLPRLVPMTRAGTPEVKEEANLLLTKLTEQGQRALDEAEPLIKDDPVAAFLLLESLPTVFRETPVANKASQLLTGLRQDRDVRSELQARTSLATIRKLETEVLGRPGGYNPRAEEFRARNAVLLRQLESSIRQMQKAYPKARATADAVQIGESYGLTR